MNMPVPEVMHTAKQIAQEGWSQLLRISIVLSVVLLQACASAELLTVPDVQSFGVADKE